MNLRLRNGTGSNFFFADRSLFVRVLEVWIFGIPHPRDSQRIAAKDRFPLFPISRNNALCAFIQEIASSNLGTVKWGLSFIVRFLPACGGKVPRFGCVLFSNPLQFIML